ncbi:MAG: hypothetical protein WD646_06700 [Actinomycetota bacterium]
MTVLLVGLGAAAAALGSRVAAVLFVGAAVAGAMGSLLPAAATWTGALAAGLVRPGVSPRRLALPALGAAAVLAAASSTNSAAVLGLWVLGTGTAFLSRGQDPRSRRWALLLCVADLPLAAAVVGGAADAGFESWPQGLGTIGSVGLLAAAALRAPLVPGAGGASMEAGLLVVRAQAVTLVLIAAGTGSRGFAEAMVAVGAAGFLCGGLVGKDSTRDGIQEISLVALASASSFLGWTPGGWEWGALAAGTLIHLLRVSAGRGSAGALGAGMLRGAGLGLPFLPVVVAQLEGLLGEREWVAAVVALGLLGGLAARARTSTSIEEPAGGKSGAMNRLLRGGWVALAGAASLWAATLALPSSLGGDAASWPPVWAVGIVAGLGAIGARFPNLAPRRAGSREPVRSLPSVPRLVDVLDRIAVSRVLEIALVCLLLAAAGLWVAGLVRGFL